MTKTKNNIGESDRMIKTKKNIREGDRRKKQRIT